MDISFKVSALNSTGLWEVSHVQSGTPYSQFLAWQRAGGWGRTPPGQGFRRGGGGGEEWFPRDVDYPPPIP